MCKFVETYATEMQEKEEILLFKSMAFEWKVNNLFPRFLD